MKVAKGYKQTELGTIPEDWEIVSLGELFDFKNGLNKEKKYFGYGTPIVNYMDVYKNRGINETDIVGKVFLSKQEIKNYEVRQGDVFFTRTSETVEEVGMASVVLEPIENTVFSGFVLRARPKSERLNNDFKKYCFSSTTTRKEIVSNSTYTTRALTNGKALSKVKIAIPVALDEQFAIANALSETDALIADLEKLIAKKQNIKQATMQVLLTGKKRLKGFKGEWKTKKLGEVAEINKGQLITAKTVEDGTIPVIAGGKQPAYYHSTPNRFGKTITVSGSGASAGYVSFHTYPIFASDCSTIQESKNYSIEFLFFFLQLIQAKIYKMQTGGAQPHIHPNDLFPIEIAIPEKEEQEAIADILTDIDAEIEALQQQLSKYKLMKEGMMQDLLTGKVRLI